MSNQLLEGVNLSLFPVFLFGDFDDPMVDEVSYVFQMGLVETTNYSGSILYLHLGKIT